MFQLESILRKDAWKWESVMHKKKSPYGDGLNDPCFDIHYVAREESRKPINPENIPYMRHNSRSREVEVGERPL